MKVSIHGFIRRPFPRPASHLFVAVMTFLLAGGARAAEADPLVNATHLLTPAAPGWGDLLEGFAHNPDTTADFTERRFFPFKKAPVELKGEARVSATRGLSLHYTAPDDLTVILDAKGTLTRAVAKDKVPPDDPGAAFVKAALLNILRLDLPALGKDFEIYGQREGTVWTLVLVPRAAKLRDNLGRITVGGEAVTIRRIEIRRTATQAIEISIAPRPPATFTAEELKKFFR
jgi:hypothetical protein